MQNNWFPQIKTDIFISHSHGDEKLTICLAGWLYETFGITSFIDSCIWGYSNDLLKIIDDKYCLNKVGNTYDYNKLKYSASHVHMMLSTALTMMIDNCECLFFFNTPNSIVTSDVINKTASPWIYSEITISKLIKKEIPERLLEIVLRSKTGSLNEGLKVHYNVDLSHLDNMGADNINKWVKEYINLRNAASKRFSTQLNPLDYLYDIYGYLKAYKY